MIEFIDHIPIALSLDNSKENDDNLFKNLDPKFGFKVNEFELYTAWSENATIPKLSELFPALEKLSIL